MKKMLYFVLPAIFLSVGIAPVFAQNNNNANAGTKVGEVGSKVPATVINVMSKEEFDAMAREMAEMKQKLDSTRQKIDAQKNTLESMTLYPNINMAQVEKDLKILLNAKEIKAGEKIDLQDMLFIDNKETAETHYYKLKLAKDAQYTLLDQKTSQPSNEESVSWLWGDFIGKYEYDFNFRLLFSKTEHSYLLIKITPVLSKEKESTLPIINVAFNFNEQGDITYGGYVRDMDSHYSFDSKLALKK